MPTRLLVFATIGSLGTGLHLTVLTLLLCYSDICFVVSETFATCVAMIFNYTLNNILTYPDRRRRGLRWLIGLFFLLNDLQHCGCGKYWCCGSSFLLARGLASLSGRRSRRGCNLELHSNWCLYMPKTPSSDR